MLQKKQSLEKRPYNHLAYVYPPDVTKSQKHRLANRIFRKLNIQQPEVDTCECCGRYLGEESDAETLFYDPLQQLSYSGPGLPLLFVFAKNMIVTSTLLILIVSVLALVLNAMTNSCIQGECNYQGFFTRLSLANDSNNFQLIVVMCLVFTLFWIILNQLLIYRCRVTEIKADQDRVTPSDFAIFLLDLPQGTNQQDIEQMLNGKRKIIKTRLQLENLGEFERTVLTQAENFKVEMIIVPYKTAEFLEVEKEQQLQFMKWIKEGSGNEFCRKECHRPVELSNSAIIIFQKEIAKSLFVKTRTFYKEFKQFVCNQGSEPNKIKLKGKQISVVRASEPDDIIWENLEVTLKSIILNKVISNLFAFFVLLIGGLIQYWLAVWQIKNPAPNPNTVIVIFSAIIVTFSNYVLSLLLIWATKKEGNFTKSKYNASLTLKICIFQFFNSGLFYTLSNLLAIQLTDSNAGIDMKQMFSNKITVCMITDAAGEAIIILSVGYFELPNSIFRLLMNKGMILCSQKNCNQIYQLNDCDIPEKYAYLIKLYWLTCFYAPFVPIVSFISLIGLVLFYFAMKISFRHFYKITSVRSNEANLRALRLSYFGPFMLNLGLLVIQIYYERYGSGELFTPDRSSKIIIVFSLILSGLYGLLPWYHMNEALKPLKNMSNACYKDVKHTFQITYDDKLVNTFRDKYLDQMNENYFLLNQVKRASQERKIDFEPFFNKFVKTASTATNEQGPFTCRRMLSEPRGLSPRN